MANTLHADEAAILRLIHTYARCCDTRDGERFLPLFAPGAVLEGPGFRFDTPEGLRGVPPALSAFHKTYHMVMNTLFQIQGDKGTGTIYTAAHHLKPLDDQKFTDYVMYITYHDSYARTSAGWLFAHRRLDYEFVENRFVEKLDKLMPL